MNQPPNEKIWEGTLDAFFDTVKQFRGTIPQRGLLTMSENGRDSHVQAFIHRWHGLALRQPTPPSPFLMLLLGTQDRGPGDTLGAAYREWVAMLLDTLYEEQDEHDEIKRLLNETQEELRECRRDMGSIKESVAAIAGNMNTVIDGIVEIRNSSGAVGY